MKTKYILLLFTAVLCIQSCIRPRPEYQKAVSEPAAQQDSLVRDVDFNLGGYSTIKTDYVIADINWIPGGCTTGAYFRNAKVPAQYNGDQVIILVKDKTISFVDKDGEINLITGDFRIYNIRRH